MPEYEKLDVPVLFSAEEIRVRVRTLALEIASSMPQDFVLVSLLRGSFVFTADLIREPLCRRRCIRRSIS